MTNAAVKSDVCIGHEWHDEGNLKSVIIAAFDKNVRNFALQRRQQGTTRGK